MTDSSHPLLETWDLPSPIFFICCVALIGIGIRLISAALKANEVLRGKDSWRSQFVQAFKGFGSHDPGNDDYWHPFILGLLELAAFPVLMATQNWTFVGAWLAFKTLAQWGRWSEHRSSFNRFLIGNALVLGASYWLAHMVRLR